MKVTPNLLETYVTRCVDGMDMESLLDFAYSTIYERLEGLDDETVLAEINEWMPDLLESEELS